MFLHLLNISLSFHFVLIAVFGVSFLQAGSSWLLLIVESAPVGGGVRVTCQGFLVRGTCVCVLVCGAGSLPSEVQ